VLASLRGFIGFETDSTIYQAVAPALKETMTKKQSKFRCPKCGCRKMIECGGKWMSCEGCKKSSKASQCIATTKVDQKRHDRGLDRARNRRKDKFLTRQSAILKNCQTVTEGEFGKRLTEAEIEFIPQWTYNVEGFAGIVDFYLPKYKLVLEVDGGYHLEDDQKLKDMEKDFICRKVLQKKVLRLTNKQALSLEMSEIMSLINKAN
jgi:very-short-patch-repair endonuclease